MGFKTKDLTEFLMMFSIVYLILLAIWSISVKSFSNETMTVQALHGPNRREQSLKVFFGLSCKITASFCDHDLGVLMQC